MADQINALISAAHDAGISLWEENGALKFRAPAGALTPQLKADLKAVIDESGTGLETGELLARGPYSVTGFVGDPRDVRGVFDQDGWYRTGDVVAVESDAGGVFEFRVIGRTKDQINRAGEKIYPANIETLLSSHPQVRSAKVVAKPHPVLGQGVHAVVEVVADEAGKLPKALALRRFLFQSSLAPFAIPESLEIKEVEG